MLAEITYRKSQHRVLLHVGDAHVSTISRKLTKGQEKHHCGTGGLSMIRYCCPMHETRLLGRGQPRENKVVRTSWRIGQQYPLLLSPVCHYHKLSATPYKVES